MFFTDPIPWLVLSSWDGQRTQTSLFDSRCAVRAPPLGLDRVKNLLQFNTRETINYLQETSADIVDWVRYFVSDKGDTSSCSSINVLLLAFCRVLKHDVVGFLDYIEFLLEDIANKSLDERDLQDNVGRWRNQLSRLLYELPTLSTSIRRFFAFPYSGRPLPQQLSTDIDDLLGEIRTMLERCERSQQLLTAEMSLLESKRGIQEAESVSRLTQLAFVFVPLTFVTGLFSMQIQEVADTPPPLYAFIIASVVALTVSYGFRAAQNSVWLSNKQRQWEEQLREEENITTRNIPIHKALSWLLAHLGFALARPTMVVLVGAGSVSLIAVKLWTKASDLSLKVAITIFISAVFLTVLALFLLKGFRAPDPTDSIFGFGRVWRMERGPRRQGEEVPNVGSLGANSNTRGEQEADRR